MKRIRIRPAKKLIKLLGILTAISLIFPILAQLNDLPELNGVPLLALVITGLVVIYDGFLSKRAPLVAVKRDVPTNLSVYVAQKVSVALANRGDIDLDIEVIEHVPEFFEIAAEPHHCHLTPGQIVEFEYTITPTRRGPANITASEIRVASKLGLWESNWWLDHETEHKVFPNFASISDLAGLQGSVNLQQAGLKKINRRGSGMDFMQLRDYREGESIKQIDWRATSRFNKLISKEFQEEKNQHVIIMLDAGRRMRVQDDELSYFDHALNSLIMLSYTALKNGDKLSVQSFGSESRWLSQVQGAHSVSRIMQHFYDLYPQKIASDYLSAAQELLQKQPKRALILLVSCLRDEDFSDLLSAVDLLKAKHLVAVISIEEPIYQTIAEQPVEDFEQALLFASSHKLKTAIDTNIQRLKQKGVMCIQAPAAHLTPSAINTYLSVKRAGLL